MRVTLEIDSETYFSSAAPLFRICPSRGLSPGFGSARLETAQGPAHNSGRP